MYTYILFSMTWPNTSQIMSKYLSKPSQWSLTGLDLISMLYFITQFFMKSWMYYLTITEIFQATPKNGFGLYGSLVLGKRCVWTKYVLQNKMVLDLHHNSFIVPECEYVQGILVFCQRTCTLTEKNASVKHYIQMFQNPHTWGFWCDSYPVWTCRSTGLRIVMRCWQSCHKWKRLWRSTWSCRSCSARGKNYKPNLRRRWPFWKGQRVIQTISSSPWSKGLRHTGPLDPKSMLKWIFGTESFFTKFVCLHKCIDWDFFD